MKNVAAAFRTVAEAISDSSAPAGERHDLRASLRYLEIQVTEALAGEQIEAENLKGKTE
jgi:hypothetical protein